MTEVFGCDTRFCCRANPHTIHRAALLSHGLSTFPQSLEICLVMQKIERFLNPAQWAAVGIEEWLGLATVLASCTYWNGRAVGLGLSQAEPLETFQNLWELWLFALQMLQHTITHASGLPATEYLRRDDFKWQYSLPVLCWSWYEQ